MKKHIKKALQWALSKFEPDPAEVAAWPFPAPEPIKNKRVSVPKATTRKTVETRFVPAKKKAVKKATKRLKALEK